MMDTFCKKILLFIAVILLNQSLIGQVTVSKKITEDFPMTNLGEFRLNNKYGEVHLYGWDKNSIAITIDISVTHTKKENANELLKRINPRIKSIDNSVHVNFEISEGKAHLINKYFTKRNSPDLSQSNVQVNYTIYLPKNSKTEVTNKFGSVIIENWNGPLKADIQHGDLWINENLNNANIDIEFGKIKAKTIEYGNIHLKNGALDIKAAIDLKLTSEGSNIDIEKVISLEIHSNKDIVTINEIGTLEGNLKFTEMEVSTLKDNTNLTLKIAELKILDIQKKDAEIIIDQVSSDIVLTISGFAFTFDAILEEGVLRLPKTFYNIDSKLIDRSKRIREVTAHYGEQLFGKISITGKKGIVLLKEHH